MQKSGRTKVMTQKKKVKGDGLRRLFYYYVYLLLVWGLFRLLFRLPEVIEEFWIKPLIWLVPVLGIWINEKRKVRFFEGGWSRAIVWGLGLGVVWIGVLALVSLGRVGGIRFLAGNSWADIMGAAVATAIVEELVFSGYIFQRVFQATKSLWSAVVMTGVMFALIHVPIGLFVYNYSALQMVAFLVVVALVEMGGGFLMAKTRNVVAPILAHFVWAVASTMIG